MLHNLIFSSPNFGFCISIRQCYPFFRPNCVIISSICWHASSKELQLSIARSQCSKRQMREAGKKRSPESSSHHILWMRSDAFSSFHHPYKCTIVHRKSIIMVFNKKSRLKHKHRTFLFLFPADLFFYFFFDRRMDDFIKDPEFCRI